jgi:predicted membrane protein
MKALNYILSIIAAGLVIFNLTLINYSNPLHEDSIVALITVITGLCAILLLTILRISKKIEKLQKIKH